MIVFIVCVCQTIIKDITYLLTYLEEIPVKEERPVDGFCRLEKAFDRVP